MFAMNIKVTSSYKQRVIEPNQETKANVNSVIRYRNNRNKNEANNKIMNLWFLVTADSTFLFYVLHTHEHTHTNTHTYTHTHMHTQTLMNTRTYIHTRYSLFRNRHTMPINACLFWRHTSKIYHSKIWYGYFWWCCWRNLEWSKS